MQVERRVFLKLAAAGVAGVTLGKARLARAEWPKNGTLDINPKISNMLVVACKDQSMVKGTPTSLAFAGQNSVIDGVRVAANLDAMAMRLANAASPDDAWKTIFRSSKPWASTLVAVKVNVTETKNMPRLAVVEKICRVVAGLGVPASNIIVYDGGPEAFASATSNYASYFSTTDTSKIPGVVSKINDSLGGTVDAKLPDGTTAPCTADIANGKVDILIDIAINKGHIYYGKASLCMKNHYGTFLANHDANYLFTINKSDALVGGTPPRQQLCIVDSLFANKTYNASPEAMPYYLVMGTFAPAVDYLTVKKIREEVLNYSHDSAIIDAYMTNFNYTTKDPQWVLIPPASATADAGVPGSGGSGAGGSAGSGGKDGAGGVAANGGHGGNGALSGATGTANGGAAAGGKQGGGASGSGGSAAKTGGASGSGGVPGSGGASAVQASGGATAHTEPGAGAGGSAASGSKTGSGTGGGGASGSGGQATGGGDQPNAGCGCRIGDVRGSITGVGLTTAIGALVLARMRKRVRDAESKSESESETPVDGR